MVTSLKGFGMGKKVNNLSKLETDCHIRFLEHCRLGGSIPEFCLSEDIDRDTFDNWCKRYPHMQAAKIKGKQLAEGYWMKLGRDHIVTETRKVGKATITTKFDTNLYKFIMGGRFGHTADRDAHQRLDEIERKLNSSTSQKIESAYAEEAECES